MSHAKFFRRSPIAAAVVAALHAAAAHAQTEPATQLPRISVEGEGDEESYKADRAASPKFTEPLLETPQTVTVIRKEVLLQQGAATLTEALRNTPGITMQLGENGNTQSGDTIFMRGFDAQNSIFIDGIRDLGAAVRDTFNVEQVEVFKGPAGADNGRGATSGYVNLASKVPAQVDAFTSSIAYGTADRSRLTADWNHTLDSIEGAAFRLNVMGQEGGVAGRDFVDRDSWGVAPSFALGLGTATRIYAYSQHIRQDNVPDGALPAVGIADYGNFSAAPVDTENFYGHASDYENIDADMFTVRFEHDFSDRTTIRNTSRYGKSEQERVLTAPIQAPTQVDPSNPATWTINRSRQASYRKNEIITNQTNLTTQFSTGSIQHSLSTGVEFIYESQFTPTMGGLGTLPAANLYNPNRNDAFTTAPSIAPTGAYSDGHTFTTAVYAFDTWELTDRWQLSTGLRWEDYDTESVTTAVTTAVPPVQSFNRAEVSDDAFSWKVGLLFKPAENGSVYVAFANSLKPPGSDNFTFNFGAPNAAGSVNVNNPNLDPQKSTNIELGTKWDLFDGRLAATAALFKSTNKNDLARTDPTDPDVVIQYGEREVKGIELGLVGQITPAWQITAGITRQDTEVTDGQISNATPGAPSTQTGSIINFSPKFSGTLWTTYRLPIGLTVGGGARHVSTQARSVTNNPASVTTGVYKVPSYTVLDLYAAYDVTPKVSVQLNAYNVTDEEYVASINNSGQRYQTGVPLSYLATVNFRF